MKRQKRHTLGGLAAYSAAAGAAALGATSTANAVLNVYDHRAAPLYPIVDYWVFDQTLMVMNVKTGDFQYVVDDLAGTPTSISRYDQAGFLDNNPIPGSELTNDTVWFSHRDVDVDVGYGLKAGDVVTIETPTGGAGGQLDASQGPVYAPVGTGHDWYWADQTYDHDNDGGTPDIVAALPLPVDGPAAFQVDGSLSFNDSSPTGYTGAVTHGFGGLGHGSGTRFYVEGPDGWAVTLGFKLEEVDGTHYGWVAIRHDADRNRVREIYGWAYETTPFLPALLSWDPPIVGAPGDFDNDGDIDSDDIGLLCANLTGSGVPAGDPKYDLDGDGDADSADMDMLIHDLVEITGGDGTGTEYGDFDLDGDIDTTDLTILATNYGVGTTWLEGNANCDLVIDTTDLTILATNFGFLASGAVPEPVTLSLLALGAPGLLAMRRRRT